MMKPIYFPFTYIPETVAEPLSQLLGPLIVVQPVLNNQPEALSRLEQNGCIEIRVPYTDDEDRLVGCSKDFTQWGRIHQGDEASLKDIFKNGFSNTASSAQIRTDILKENKDVPFNPDPVFLSRLFLLMAQELDLQQSGVEQELALSIDDEMVLFTSMTGEEKILDPPKETYVKSDYGAYMTGSRMTAWSRLVKKTADESAFFVTDSPAVFDNMNENMTGLEAVCSLEGISLEQSEAAVKELAQFLMHLATTPWTGPDQIVFPDLNCADDRKLNFKLYILPEADPVNVCSFFSKDKILSKQEKGSWVNMLIGFFEI